MKNIFKLICFIILCIGINSCTVYPTDGYVYTRTVYYPSYGVYYRPAPPPPSRHYHHKPHHKPKHQYNKPPHNKHNSKPHNSNRNNRHQRH